VSPAEAIMSTITQRFARTTMVAAAVAALGGCSQAGSLGNVLGSVLGGGQTGGSQVSGTIQSVDTRNQQINLRQSNGQGVSLVFDQQTKVVYQNQNYGVTSLEYGDQVTARVQSTQNGGYYTDLVQVDQPVAGSGGTATSNSQVYSLQGTVRRLDVQNGLFEIANGNQILTVSMPYNPTRADQQRFQNLRVGDVARFQGVYLNSSRVELRQFQ
ncbi:MAG: hypothetical protein ABIZ69_11385, partial [Ilumatobacteraceae bacterium]